MVESYSPAPSQLVGKLIVYQRESVRENRLTTGLWVEAAVKLVSMDLTT